MIIPTSIYKLSHLAQLDLEGCTTFCMFPSYSFPQTVPERNELCSLQILNLRGCNLSEANFLITHSFDMLQWLDLSNNKFTSIPSFSKLSNLPYLSLSDCCQLLQEIPELPEYELNLNAINCKSLIEAPGRFMAKLIFNYNMVGFSLSLHTHTHLYINECFCGC